VLLARHGRTADTERGVFSGRGGADPPLSPAGEADAGRLAAALRTTGAAGSPLAGLAPVDAVVASPLVRAQATAKAVADRLGVDVRTDDDWAEMAFGAWEGLTHAEVARRDPEGLAAKLSPSGWIAPSGGCAGLGPVGPSWSSRTAARCGSSSGTPWTPGPARSGG